MLFRSKRLANRSQHDSALLDEAVNAEDRAVDYSTECLAHEVFRRPEDRRQVIDVNDDLSEELQDRFDAMHEVLDRHVPPGSGWNSLRRALLDRAVPHASFSSHAAGHDWTDDYEGIADELNNEHEAESITDGENERERIDGGHEKRMSAIHESRLSRYVLDRELGLRPTVPHDALPSHEPFDAGEAERAIEELGYLRQVLRDRIRTIDYVFADERDRVPYAIGDLIDERRSLERRLQPPQHRLRLDAGQGASRPGPSRAAPRDAGQDSTAESSSADEPDFDPPIHPLRPGPQTAKRRREDDDADPAPGAKRPRPALEPRERDAR